MNIPFYLYPLTFGIVSFITTFITFYIILLPRYGLVAKLIPGLFSHLDRLDTLPLEQEITPLLEDKISHFMNDLTAQIPMGSMILNGSLGQSIKSKAKLAALETLPELKSKGLEKGQQLLIQKQHQYWKRLLLKYGATLALLSGVLGALCGLLLYLCCRSS